MSWESQSWELKTLALLSASLALPFLLAAAAWLILRVFRVRHPASRHTVWAAALAGTLLLPILSVIVPHWKVPVPPSKSEPAPAVLAGEPTAFTAPEPLDSVAQPISRGGKPAPGFQWPPVEALVIGLYFAGFLAMCAYRVTGWALLRRVISRSRRLSVPWLRESGDIITPVVVGLLRPAVLLPVGWRDWTPETQAAVLAHEFAHIRRHDGLVSSFARFVKCVLWFHPLAWWISREISNLAEWACDAVALETVNDPAGYSRVLLEFASIVNRTGFRVALPGLAMASPSGPAGSNMAQRIDQVFELSRGNPRKLARPGVMLALAGVPVMCLAATVGLGSKQRQVQPAAPPLPLVQLAQAVPSPRPAPAMVVAEPAPVTAASLPEFDAVEVRVNKLADPPDAVIISNPAEGRFPTETMGWFSGQRMSQEPAFAPTGAVSLRYVTLRQLITQAYIHEITREEYLKGPGWLDSDRFDLIAKAPPDSSVDTERLMIQRALAERFHLRLHREGTPMPVYALVVGKKGLKLQPSAGSGTPDCKTTSSGFLTEDRQPAFGGEAHSGFACKNMTMAELANRLSGRLVIEFRDKPVVDRTGVTGAYDFQADWTVPLPERGAPRLTEQEEADRRSAVIETLEQQLGLTLVEQKQPAKPVIVVDHVDRAPVEN